METTYQILAIVGHKTVLIPLELGEDADARVLELLADGYESATVEEAA